ncbi:uncharacterized protein LOC124540488 [Vanessa cardui]|uniref:uncharacterized protein LOC124540488 n=1 Tax=Vanessa cardui TaxID=171605 RepID=UPI001F13A86E|nr:uncharacterized protein LOC124540488 [Vanessa cardui]
MDAPCYDLTEEGNGHAQSNPCLANDIQLTVSSSHSTIDTYGKETYDLLERVCLEIKHGKEDEDDLEEYNEERYLEQAQRYTGLHKNVLYKLWKDSIAIDCIKEIDRRDIHDEIMRYNLEWNIMPTSTDLFNSLQNHLPPYLDIKSFRNKLVKMGYIFKKTDSNTVVVENPVVRFERFMYLKNVMRYREENRSIYYICQGGLTADKILNVDECERYQHKAWMYRFIYAVSSKKIKCFKHVPDGFSFEKWMLETAVNLDNNSIIIIDNFKQYSEQYCKTPNRNSLRCDMIEWLKYHQIPHSKDTMNRLELWMLIEKYTDLNSNLYKIDNLLNQFGHKVLRLPDCINNLTPASFIHNIIQMNLKRDIVNMKIVIKHLEDVVSAIGEKELNEIESSLVAEEARLLDLDLKLENVIDDLSPSTDPELDTYLPSLSDSE